jgi:ankyrin repeat protein
LVGTLQSTPLYVAAQGGHTSICNQLIAADATVVNVSTATEDGQNPLYIATSCGHETCVRLLLEHGAVVTESIIECAVTSFTETHEIITIMKQKLK